MRLSTLLLLEYWNDHGQSSEPAWVLRATPLQPSMSTVLKAYLKAELHTDLKAELKAELQAELAGALGGVRATFAAMHVRLGKLEAATAAVQAALLASLDTAPWNSDARVLALQTLGLLAAAVA